MYFNVIFAEKYIENYRKRYYTKAADSVMCMNRNEVSYV